MTIEELKKKKVVILGLGVNHRHLAEYFKIKKTPFKVIGNWQSADELVGKLDNFDIIFRTPGLPYTSQAIKQALDKGAQIYSQTKLFFDLCPASIIGVTGTKGKGTTATLIYNILTTARKKAWLAGNIGQDPFEFLDQIQPEDFVVLELSSFQLQDLHKSPHVTVVLKITPEHLDHHQTLAEYIDAKKSIVKYQNEQDFAVLNYDNEETRSFAQITKAKIIWNSTNQEVKPGCYVQDEKVVLNTPLTPSLSPLRGRGRKSLLRTRYGGEGETIMDIAQVKLLGRFNLENVTAAVAAVAAVGVTEAEVIRKVISDFKGLPHRLEFVRELKGVKFYNDSASTTPETTTAAVSAFAEPIILIVGGSEKNADYSRLAQTIADSKIKALIPIGLIGPKIAAQARQAGYQGRIVDEKLENMEKIVTKANELALAGDVVLLSPATASFDMFKNYLHRGELFKKFVERL